MHDTTTMPHEQDRTDARPDVAPDGHRPPVSAGRAPRPLTPAAREALGLAAAATDLVRDALEQMQTYADCRRRAVLRAVREGATYSRVAAELGVSVGSVQHLVDSARTRAGERDR